MHTTGIHHITALSSNAQKTLDFYTKVLGLRLVKLTVNFDAPDVYHFYFGNEQGEPGTVLTFFPFEDAGTGMRGVGQVTKIYFSVPLSALGFWLERFVTKSVRHEGIKSRFDEKYISFYDPDGLALEIVGTNDHVDTKPWQYEDIPTEHAIRAFHGAEIGVESQESIHDLLTENLGYELKQQEELRLRYENKHAGHAKYLDLFLMRGWPEGIVSAGTVHHIAFRVKNNDEQAEIRKELIAKDFHATGFIDRNYFRSIYFRERNQVLFEIATDEPGFTIDEKIEDLGSELKLPEQFESQRAYIESHLPKLHRGSATSFEGGSDLDLFQHKFIDNNAANTLVLFHGTGGTELEMAEFIQGLGTTANILSLRGNVREGRFSRFFVRNDDGSFDYDNIPFETEKLERFLKRALVEYQIVEQPLTFIGYSNGANFLLAYLAAYPIKAESALALHPMLAFREINTNLQGTKITITHGDQDEYSTPEQISALTEKLTAAGADLTVKQFKGGHHISEEEALFIKSLIN